MRVIRVIALATALLVVGGTASALATSWGSYSLPQPIWFSGATSWNNQVVQVGGLGFPGNKYQPLVAAFEFNPFGGSTQNLHPLPSARFGDAVVTGQDGFVYAFGGLNASNAVLGSAVRTDPTLPTNIWAARAPLPIPRVALSAAVASNGLIYTIGGDRAVSGAISLRRQWWRSTTPPPTPGAPARHFHRRWMTLRRRPRARISSSSAGTPPPRGPSAAASRSTRPP